MLEFLGAIGIAREFARGPKDWKACQQRILSRRAGIQGRLTLPRAQEISRGRLERMGTFLDWLDEESFRISHPTGNGRQVFLNMRSNAGSALIHW